MNFIRKTSVLIKTERTTLIRRQSADENIFCNFCGGQMIPAQASADLAAVSSRVIYRLIEAEKIHFIETEVNKIYVCTLSIKKTGKSAEERISHSNRKKEVKK